VTADSRQSWAHLASHLGPVTSVRTWRVTTPSILSRSIRETSSGGGRHRRSATCYDLLCSIEDRLRDDEVREGTASTSQRIGPAPGSLMAAFLAPIHLRRAPGAGGDDPPALVGQDLGRQGQAGGWDVDPRRPGHRPRRAQRIHRSDVDPAPGQEVCGHGACAEPGDPSRSRHRDPRVARSAIQAAERRSHSPLSAKSPSSSPRSVRRCSPSSAWGPRSPAPCS